MVTTLIKILGKKVIVDIEEIKRAFGIKKLNELQEISIPKLISGKNAIIVAPTGFGKTEAAMIPVFYRIIKEGGRCIYITPLRALNRDMLGRLLKAGEKLGIKVDVRHGDTPQRIRRKQVKEPPDILITTPETFQIIFFGKKLRNILKDVRYVIIDEVHELIGSKRGVQLSLGLERLKEISGKFQRILLSATVKRPREYAEYFMGGEEFEVIDYKGEKKYDIEVLFCERTEKVDRELSRMLITTEKVAWSIRKIYEILKENKGSAIIFTNTRETAEMLSSKLKRAFPEIPIEIHHSSLSRDVRETHEKLLKEGRLKALIATSSMELGIDIGHISFVIQYMSPRQVKRLVQRVGRAGHKMGKVSKGYVITLDIDDYAESLAISDLQKEGYLEEEEIYENAYDVLAHQIVGILIDKGNTDLDEVYRIVRRSKFYRNIKPEEIVDIILFLEKIGVVRTKGKKIYKGRRSLLYYIENVSMIPDEKSFLVIDEESNTVIGILHEEFVMKYGEVGNIIVIKGECWRIVDISGDKIIVRQEEGIGEIPMWEGEMIPVDMEVAQRATEYRKELVKKYYKNPWIPEKDKIIIEYDYNHTVINSPFGLKVNETIGRIVAKRIGDKYGVDVKIKVDPYRIFLEGVEPKDVVGALREGFKEEDLEDGIRRTKLFLIKMFHVGRRFGVFSKDMSYELSYIRKAVERLEGTPVEKEALREIIIGKMDVKNAKKIFERIRRGEIKIEILEGISDYTKDSSFEIGDILVSRSDYLRLIKERIENTELLVYCPNEDKILWKRKVKEIDSFECPRCKGFLSFIKEKDVGKKEKIGFNRDLVKTFGKNALYLIASIVPDNQKVEILRKYSGDFERMIKEIAIAERRALRAILGKGS